MSDTMHGGYNFALLDPRNGPQAQATNDRLFASGPVYGVDVTVPALAERCVENIDPQHSANITTAAIEAALTHGPPPVATTIATVRPDLDAFGAMAVLADATDPVRSRSPWGQGPYRRHARARNAIRTDTVQVLELAEDTVLIAIRASAGTYLAVHGRPRANWHAFAVTRVAPLSTDQARQHGIALG